jgi:hypothetical protein
MPIVLCNAGPLMALGKLNRLDFLARLYGEVQIPRLQWVSGPEADLPGVRLAAPGLW